MNIHNNAVFTPRSRALMVAQVLDHGWSFRATARHFRVDPKTVRRWVARYLKDGAAGLVDRSSSPRRQPRRTPLRLVRQVAALRRQRWTMDRIGSYLKLSRATVGRILKRLGLNKLSALDPVEPPRRYEHEHPGDMLHLDIKKLARFRVPGHRVTRVRTKTSVGVGWEHVHVAIDDRSRVAFSQIHPNEGKASAIAHLRAAVKYYASLGVTIRRVLTDNGPCYRSKAFDRACSELDIKHRFTKPYRPQTNGKAERFIKTALNEWAYAFRYHSSNERAKHLPRWLHDYNWHRPHGSLKRQTPISILSLDGDNVMRLHS